jgi:hypothetical protein
MSQIVERPHPGALLSHAFELINARGTDYDNAQTLEQNFLEAAAVASVVIGKTITARDVAMIFHCVKLIRSKSSPGKLDNYVDGMNYMAFAACFTGLVPLPPLGAPAPGSEVAKPREAPREAVLPAAG